MKSLGKCRGCNRRKLVNLMRLCKNCNKEAHKHLTKKEMAQIQKEITAAAVSTRAAKDAQKVKDEEKKEAADEKAKEEGESSEEETPAEDEKK